MRRRPTVPAFSGTLIPFAERNATDIGTSSQGARHMPSDSTDPADKLIGEIHHLHTAAWAGAAPPTSQKEVYQRAMADTMRSLSIELLRQGVTTAIMEGAYLLWWVRMACINHDFAEGGF